MQLEISRQSRVLELWLTRGEKDDPVLREVLTPIFRHYRDRGYLAAVYLSGEADLYQQTRDLLLYNRRRLAEQAVQAQDQPAARRA